MGDTYCYSDINEIIQQLTALYQITEQAMDDMVAAGTSLSGCEGQAADAFRARFSSDYTALKGELVTCRENAFQKITQLYDGFTAIDSSTNAVISISQLTANNNFLNESTGRFISEAESYNAILQSIAHIPVSCQRVDVFGIDAQKNDITHFLTNLGMKLLETDSEASAAIRESFADYQSFLAKVLTFFDMDVQAALLVNLHGALPLHVYDGIATQLGNENELLELSELLYANKKQVMKDMNLKTDEEFKNFVRQCLEVLTVQHEYKEAIQEYLDMPPKKRLEFSGKGTRTAYADFLFLSAPELSKDLTLEQRKDLLAYLKEKGVQGMDKDEMSKLLGFKVSNQGDGLIGIVYSATGNNISYEEVVAAAKEADYNRILFALNIMGLGGMKYKYPNALKDEIPTIGKGAKENYRVPAKGTSGNLKYSDRVDTHLQKPEGITKAGASGGHNSKNFNKYFTDENIPYKQIGDVKKHPQVEGIYDVEYKIGKQVRGKYLPNEYKSKTYKKTLYDPDIISDAQMSAWGKEAMNNGKKITTIGGQEIIQGQASNGLKFEGFVENGIVDNFYPVLDYVNYKTK